MNVDTETRVIELLQLPQEILEIIIKNLEVSDILNLARVDSYFSSFLPDDVFYGEYKGYAMYNEDEKGDEEYSDEHEHEDEDDGECPEEECYGYEGPERPERPERPDGWL
jgi:hypothetical protein